MIGLLAQIFITAAMGFTLESDCQKIEVVNNEAKRSVIEGALCLHKESSLMFPSFEEDHRLIVESKEEEGFFCKAKMDQLSIVKNNTNEVKYSWKVVSNIGQLVSLTTNVGVLKYKVEQSEKEKRAVCGQVLGLIRVRKVPPLKMSPTIKSMKDGGYMLISSTVSALLFIDKKLDSLQFSLNFNEDLRVSDAILRSNNDLILLTNDEGQEKNGTCMEKWDFIAGNIVKSRCDLKYYREQILIDKGDVIRVYKDGDSLFFETFNDKFESSIIHEVKNAKDFNLNSATAF